MKSTLAAVALASALAAPVRAGDCDPGYDGGSDDFSAIASEILALPDPAPAGLTIGGQTVLASGPTRTVDRLRGLKPRIDALIGELGAVSDRPVLVVETETDTYDGTYAFTLCPGADDPLPVIEGLAVPEGACVIVVYPDRIEDGAFFDFVLAHEWMHTLQTGTYGLPPQNLLWWREGTADWFAHRVVPGFAGRDDVAAQFFDEQQTCTLTDIAYPSQVFFFWGERAFYSRWVFEIGLGSVEYLSGPARVSSILPPEAWLDWAKAQADHAVTFPDDRPLPAQVPVERIEPGDACSLRIEGPPLSAQVREVEFPAGFSRTVRVQSGTAQVAMRTPDGAWTTLEHGALLDPPPPGPLTLAAIQPSGADLDVTLLISDGTVPGCACYVGAWMEQPLDDGFRFRLTDPQSSPMIAAMAGEAGIRQDWRHAGPILSIAEGGSYHLADPVVATMVAPGTDTPLVEGGGLVWQLDLTTSETHGRWHEDRGRLFLTKESEVKTGTFTVMGAPQPWDESRPIRRDRAPGVWTPVCRGDELSFYGPMYPEMRATGATPELVARFKRMSER